MVLYRDVVELISITATEDADGYITEMETRTEVFADAQSVKREEFYKGLQAGVELNTTFIIRACDFDSQKHLEFDGKRYTIVRTYTKDGEMLELNCSEEKRAKD